MFTKLFRIGRDAEVRFTPSGEPVCELALAYNYGKKVDGKMPSQWVKAALWGKRAEALAPYLKKGQQIVASLEDVHVKSREHEGKTYTDLLGRIANIEFAGSPPAQAAPAPRPAANVNDQRRAAPVEQDHHGTGFDDDIPFAPRHWKEG